MPYKDKHSPEALASLRAARRKHYHNNKQAYIDRAVAKREDLRAYLRAQKDNPCTDCDIKYPYYVMQFDHIGDDKLYTVSTLVSLGNLKKIQDEIAKCQLVCANCHAVRTHMRLSVKGQDID